MGYRDHDSGKGIQIILQDRKGRDIKVIPRLVEQKHVRILRQNTQEIQPAFLSSRELADRSILHVRRKKEALQQLRRADLSVLCGNILGDILYIIDHTLTVVHILFFLCKIADLHCIADVNMPGIRLCNTGDHLHDRGLAAPVRSNDAKPLILQDDISEIFQYLLLTITLADMVEFDRLLSHPRLHGIQLHSLILHRRLSALQRFQAFKPRSLFRTSRTASPLCPFQLHPKDTLPLPFRRKLHLFPCRLQLQKSGVVRIVAIHLSTADLQDPVRHPVQEISVVGHHDDRAAVRPQILLQPGDHAAVQVVGRLIQQKNVKVLREDLREDNSSLLPAGEMADRYIVLPDPQLCQAAFHLPVLSVSPVKCVGADIRILGKYRILGYIRDLQSILPDDLPGIRVLFFCDHLEKCGFSRPIDPNDPDLVSLLDTERGVVKDRLLTVNLADMFYVYNIHSPKLLYFLIMQCFISDRKNYSKVLVENPPVFSADGGPYPSG